MVAVSTWSEAIFDLNGRPLPGTAVTIYTDVAGTILAPVFTDATGATPQPGSTYTTVAVGDPTFEPGNLTVFAGPGSYIGRALGQNRIFPVVVPVSAAYVSAAYAARAAGTSPVAAPTPWVNVADFLPGATSVQAAAAAASAAAGPAGLVIFPPGAYAPTAAFTPSVPGQEWWVLPGAVITLANGANSDLLDSSVPINLVIDGIMDANAANQTAGGGTIQSLSDGTSITGVGTLRNTRGLGINLQGNDAVIDLCVGGLVNCGGPGGGFGFFIQPPVTNGADITGTNVRVKVRHNTAGNYGGTIRGNGTAIVRSPRVDVQGVFPSVASPIALGCELWNGVRDAVVTGTVIGATFGWSFDHADGVNFQVSSRNAAQVGVEIASTNRPVGHATVDGNNVTVNALLYDGAAGSSGGEVTVSGINTTGPIARISGGDHNVVHVECNAPGQRAVYAQNVGPGCRFYVNGRGGGTITSAVVVDNGANTTLDLYVEGTFDGYTTSAVEVFSGAAHVYTGVQLGPIVLRGGTPAHLIVTGLATLGQCSGTLTGVGVPAATNGGPGMRYQRGDGGGVGLTHDYFNNAGAWLAIA